MVKCIVGVAFKTNHIYYYIYDRNSNVDVKDFVVVDSPHDGYVVVEVKEVLPFGSRNATKYVICKVADKEYKERLEREKRLKELEAAAKKRAEEFQKVEMLKIMAERDPIMKGILDEMEKLKD